MLRVVRSYLEDEVVAQLRSNFRSSWRADDSCCSSIGSSCMPTSKDLCGSCLGPCFFEGHRLAGVVGWEGCWGRRRRLEGAKKVVPPAM